LNYSQINAYSFDSGTTNPTSSKSQSSKTSTSKSTLDMQDFFKLLTAQMQNQSCLDPSSDTEYMSQMASFSSLAAMQQLNTTATSQLSSMNTSTGVAYTKYAASLIGKTVTVQFTNEDDTIGTDTGVVDSVNYLTDPASITIGDKTYNLTSVVKVSKTPD
jgi:flagellar basal-body rod modification protein FlgD